MVGFSTSSRGADKNGTQRTIFRRIFYLATDDPGTKACVEFRTYWTDKEHEDINKLTA